MRDPRPIAQERAGKPMSLPWRGRILRTYGDVGDVVAEIARDGDREEAQRFLEAYGEVTEHARHNVGYLAGYYDPWTMGRIFEVFDVEHPVFGRRTDVTPEEALKAGRRLAFGHTDPSEGRDQ